MLRAAALSLALTLAALAAVGDAAELALLVKPPGSLLGLSRTSRAARVSPTRSPPGRVGVDAALPADVLGSLAGDGFLTDREIAAFSATSRLAYSATAEARAFFALRAQYVDLLGAAAWRSEYAAARLPPTIASARRVSCDLHRLYTFSLGRSTTTAAAAASNNNGTNTKNQSSDCLDTLPIDNTAIFALHSDVVCGSLLARTPRAPPHAVFHDGFSNVLGVWLLRTLDAMRLWPKLVAFDEIRTRLLDVIASLLAHQADLESNRPAPRMVHDLDPRTKAALLVAYFMQWRREESGSGNLAFFAVAKHIASGPEKSQIHALAKEFYAEYVREPRGLPIVPVGDDVGRVCRELDEVFAML